MKVTLIFVGGDTQIDKIIKEVTGGEISHVAGILFDSVYEATGMKEENDKYPGIWLHDINKYKDNPDAHFIELEIPDYENMKKKARELIGTLYGYSDCIRGGLKDLIDYDSFLDSEDTMHCSETWTTLLRAGGINVLAGISAGSITPQRLYEAVQKIA